MLAAAGGVIALPLMGGRPWSVESAGPGAEPAARAVAGALGLGLAGSRPLLIVGPMPALVAAARRGVLHADLPEPPQLEPEWRTHGLDAARRFAWPLGVEPGHRPMVHGVGCAARAPLEAGRAMLSALGEHRLLARELGWFPVHRIAWGAALAVPR